MVEENRQELKNRFSGYRVVDGVVQNRNRFFFVANKQYKDEQGNDLVDQPEDGDKRVVRVDVEEDVFSIQQVNLTGYHRLQGRTGYSRPTDRQVKGDADHQRA